jgi:hypothetical protein
VGALWVSATQMSQSRPHSVEANRSARSSIRTRVEPAAEAHHAGHTHPADREHGAGLVEDLDTDVDQRRGDGSRPAGEVVVVAQHRHDRPAHVADLAGGAAGLLGCAALGQVKDEEKHVGMVAQPRQRWPAPSSPRLGE